jgi:hypothetical protein
MLQDNEFAETRTEFCALTSCVFVHYVTKLIYTCLKFDQALVARIISANTPAAVTSAPAPAPLTTKGCS